MFEQFQGRSLLKFTETFPDTEKCKNYLAEIKWNKGFECSSYPFLGKHQTIY